LKRSYRRMGQAKSSRGICASVFGPIRNEP